MDPRTDCRHRSHPLVPKPHRELRMAIVEVLHVTGEELNISAADTSPLDVDDHLARAGNWGLHLVHRRFARAGHDEGPHRRGQRGARTF